MAYRCSGHGKDDVALTGNLTYTGTYLRAVLCFVVLFCTVPYTQLHYHSLISATTIFIILDAISSIIDLNKDGIASNWEYFIAMDPNNMYGNDYVWDHFNWDHCA